MRTAEDIVRMEVHYCVSSLVSILAANDGKPGYSASMFDLCEQALELASPIEDWEEAARDAGWREFDPPSQGSTVCRNATEAEKVDDDSGPLTYASDWQDACNVDGLEPYDREVFEHWIVSDWLADKLAAKGEKVDKDFAGMTVWARTTTGQGIAGDWVIESIIADLKREYGEE
ncbi:MAG: hypothetical protein E5V63_29635 [Mesorhizobium sp.]|nr:MAG: hypothetical protein E5V63_29635 [Mesorhizobium sp.]